eukprot:Nk52_evm34s288 gene=Nk52_evmTU34s288
MAQAENPSDSTPSIKKLSQQVVNKIAAGEVIQRPANALKELMENSIDAGSTSIQVTVKEGGLKFLQIQDNGCGIRKGDMSIVCERFTTSKLNKFEDLNSIATHGFRGEALASVSHVANLSITTRTANSQCAYRAQYSDGKLIPDADGSAEPKPCAGNKGTTITVENLFYNILTRKRALKSPSEEYSKILDVVSRYAVHNVGIAMSLKKVGDKSSGVRTLSSSSRKDNIRQVYGSAIARELIEFEFENESYSLKAKASVTNANFSLKKAIFLMFINHRSVECESIKKAIQAVYSLYLPKHMHPFVYISLEMAPQNVDVNVHPTKKEVHFLNEDEIVDIIQKEVESKLLGANNSRTYYTQMLLPGASAVLTNTAGSDGGPTKKKKPAQVYDHNLVRTDCTSQTLDSFVVMEQTPEKTRSSSRSTRLRGPEASQDEPEDGKDDWAEENDEVDGVDTDETQRNCILSKTSVTKTKTEVKLTSVLELIDEFKGNSDGNLKEMLENSVYVGCVDTLRCMFQHKTELYLANSYLLSKELAYQMCLTGFSNFGDIKLEPAGALKELLLIALDSCESGWTEEDGPKEDLVFHMANFLVSKRSLLEEYFRITINESGCICCLPVLFPDYVPELNRLPIFLLRLAAEVEWDSERECFDTISKEIAEFYAFRKLVSQETEASKGIVLCNGKTYEWNVAHILHPLLKSSLFPPAVLGTNGAILKVASLHDLYKVFERC